MRLASRVRAELLHRFKEAETIEAQQESNLKRFRDRQWHRERAEPKGGEEAMREKQRRELDPGAATDLDPGRQSLSKGSILSRLIDLLLGIGWLALLVYLFVRFIRRVWL
jgi:hypothetical protein